MYGLIKCAFRARFEWGDATPNFRIEVSGVVGVVAVQTMLAVARSDGLAICTACRGVYAPKQKPKSGRNNYCPECRNPGRSRDAKHRQRAKDKQTD